MLITINMPPAMRLKSSLPVLGAQIHGQKKGTYLRPLMRS